MHCNLRPPVPRLTLLFFRFNYDAMPSWRRWTYPLPYYGVFAANRSTLIYAVTLTFQLWPWTLQCIVCKVTKLSVWPCDLEHSVTCCARRWDNFHQVWPSTTCTCLNNSFLMLILYVTLWPWPLTAWHLTFTALRVSCA